MADQLLQPQAYDAEGNPVAPDVAADAVAKGQAFYQKGAKVYAKNQRGELVTVDASEAAKPGYRVLTQGELGTEESRQRYGEGIGNVAKATAAGAARGLTLGASDALLTAAGGEDTRKALEGLRQANPAASVASEIGGALAPVVLSGGTAAPAAGASALARGGQAAAGAVKALGAGHRAIAGAGSIVERGVARGLQALGADGATALGRVGASAAKLGARGAVEGSLYGAAQAANDAVLQGDDITAEKIVAGIGHGALFGGALGAGLGGGGKLLGEGLERLVPKKEALKQLARDQALDAAGFTGPQRGKLMGRATGKAGQARLDATADDLLDTVLQSGERKGERVLKPGANVGETLENITLAKNEFGAKLGGLKDEISERMAAAGEAPNIEKFFQRVKDEVTGPLFSSKIQGARSQARAVERQLETLVDEHATRLAAAQGDAAAMARIQKGEVSAAAPTFRELEQVRADLRKVFQPQAPPTGGLPPAPPKSAQYLEKAERILADVLKEDAGNFLAKVGENPNAYNELNRQFSSFAKLEQVAGKAEQMALGRRSISPSDHALGLASFMGAMATGNVGALGAMGYGAAATAANKLLRERGNSLVASLAKRASETDNVIDSAAKALAGTGEKVKAPALTAAFTGEGLSEQYQRTAERVRELAQPAFAQQHVSGMIPEVAAQYPNVGAAVSRKLLAIYNELSQRIPASHVDTGTTLTPLAVKTRVSPVQQRKFLNTVAGALQPEKVIADLGRGVVNRDGIEMMKVVHPLMFQQLRTQVAEAVQQREKEIPFQRRIMLSTVFEFVGDSSLEPTRFTALQQMTKAMTIQDAAKDAQAIKPKQGNPGSASKLGDSIELPAQAAAGDV